MNTILMLIFLLRALSEWLERKWSYQIFRVALPLSFAIFLSIEVPLFALIFWPVALFFAWYSVRKEKS